MVPDDEALSEGPPTPPSRPSTSLNLLEETIESLERILLDLRMQLGIYRKSKRLSRRISCSACGEKASDSSDTLLSGNAMSDRTASSDLEESTTHSAENSNDLPFRLRSARRLKGLF